MPTTSFRPNSSLAGIAVTLLSVSTLRRISILQAESVEDSGAFAKDGTDAREDLVLEDVEVEVDEGRVLVCLLQAARVQGHREAVDGIGEQVAQDRLRLSGLGQEDVDRPDRVA